MSDIRVEIISFSLSRVKTLDIKFKFGLGFPIQLINLINSQKHIPKPVWAVGFALKQTLHVVALAVFRYVISIVDKII
ncbi:MAG: hypothetical protein LBH59_07320 [Planctomycetaceae bacterium]|nr:hypothetical protein [Planctomycetaceae bacterium]